MLKDIKSMNQNIFLTVDTTCPLARCETPSTPKTPSGFEPPPTIGKKNKSSNNIIDLFWTMHPTKYLVGCVIQKRYFHSTIYLHLPNNHRFRIDSFSNCLSWILSTGNIGSFNSQNHSIHKIFSCLNQ